MKMWNRAVSISMVIMISAITVIGGVTTQAATTTHPANRNATQSQEAVDWISGKWKGIMKRRADVSATFYLTYDPATSKITGSAEIFNPVRMFSVDGKIEEGEYKNGKIILKVYFSGPPAPIDGTYTTFVLERKDDGSLVGGGENSKLGWFDLSLRKADK